MINVNIKLYTIHELNEKAKTKAIEDHRYFLLDMLVPDYIDGIIDWNDPEKMEMYHEEYNYILNNDDYVIENIEINDYYYYFNGEMVPVLHCTAGPLSGITMATIHGENIKL